MLKYQFMVLVAAVQILFQMTNLFVILLATNFPGLKVILVHQEAKTETCTNLIYTMYGNSDLSLENFILTLAVDQVKTEA